MISKRFPYTQPAPDAKVKAGMPMLPLTLASEQRSIAVTALVDSGATLSILPYDLGLQLGLTWGAQEVSIFLGGILQGLPAYGVALTGHLPDLDPFPLVFAWTSRPSTEVPVIVGQINFFRVFQVTLNGKDGWFEVQRL